MISHPTILTIGSTDNICGAGVLADIKTLSALDSDTQVVIVAVTAQTPKGLLTMEVLESELILQQARACVKTLEPQSIKTGLLIEDRVISLVAAYIETRLKDVPLIVDPVALCKGKAIPLTAEAIAAYKQKLLPLATVATPNLAELSIYTDEKITSRQDLLKAVSKLAELTKGKNVVVKGIIEDSEIYDLLWENGQIHWFGAPYIKKMTIHGGGCALASALANGLSLNMPLSEAMKRAHTYTQRGIKKGKTFQLDSQRVYIKHFVNVKSFDL